MKIAFDAKRITHNATGLGNYGRFVVNSLTKFHPENEYRLYSPKPGREACREQINSSDNLQFLYPTGNFYSNFPLLWRSYYLTHRLLRDKVDLFHGLSNELPIHIEKSGIPSVVTIHDLIFNRHPEYYKYLDRTIYNYKFNRACIHANKIIAVSETTKNDIMAAYGIPESKIEVVYQGCHPVFNTTIDNSKREEVAARFGITRPYILYVGSIEERKNLLLIVKALKLLDKETTLVAIGKRTPYTKVVETFIKENNLEQRVKILNNVMHDDLPALFQSASVFVYPSFFEGFGIPIVEALSSGVPVIAATGSCLEEAGGSDSLYVDPNNDQQLASYIKEVINNSQLAEEMIVKGKAYAKRFSPEVSANRLMAIYQRLT